MSVIPRRTFRPQVESLDDRVVPAMMIWLGSVDSAFTNPANWLEDSSPATRAPQYGDDLHFSGHFTSNNCEGLVEDPYGAYASITFNSFSGIVYLAGDVVTEVLNLYGGEIRNTADGQDITVTGSLNWLAGTINGSSYTGTLIVSGSAATAEIAPAGGGTVSLGSNLSLLGGRSRR